jgi:hypothetical protein
MLDQHFVWSGQIYVLFIACKLYKPALIFIAFSGLKT